MTDETDLEFDPPGAHRRVSVNEKVKELVFVDFTVYLLVFAGHVHSKQTF
ncbi:hypothetical protein [Natrarchaeobius halalkaliphilus]|nr:hypothetical protein [Natrarchaeobius halalkaliphilus]